MRYMILILCMVCMEMVWGVERPGYAFASTSAMEGSGSALTSSAATGGAFMTTVSAGAPVMRNIGGARRIGEDEGFEDEEEPALPANPMPIGDGVWWMIVLALIWNVVRRKCNKNKVFVAYVRKML